MRREFPLGARSALVLDQADRLAARPASLVNAAATVMLLRDAVGGVEVFAMRRVAAMAFAPGMTVFPGGRVDRSDFAPDVPEEPRWGQRLGFDDPLARAVVVAAVRELFEECGVLLAGPSAVELVSDVTTPAWRAERAGLLTRSTTLPRLLEEHELVLRDDLLVPRARWVTPTFEERRYDTVFFAAAVPAGQDADDQSSETDLAGWVSPQEVLASFAAGEVALLPPTIVALETLAAARTAAGVLATDGDLWPVLPVLVNTADGPVIRADVPS